MITLRGKTNLACDTCRQRKSRCDGTRPACSHCVRAGRRCTYRPTPTNLETDVSVLSRLADAEARIQALEGGAGQNTSQRSTATPTPTFSAPPQLHTAAAYKLLHCWPRIRLNLSIPGVVPETYLADYDHSDPLLLEWTTGARRAVPPLMVWQAAHAMEGFYGSTHRLPVYFSYLFDHYPPLSSDGLDRGSLARSAVEGISQRAAVVDLQLLSIPQLLVLSMAMRTVDAEPLDMDPAHMMALAEASCAMALQKQWLLRSGPDEDLVPMLLALSYYLAYFWARPFHALGVLQSIAPAIKHMHVRQPDDRVRCYSQLYYLLESDILTEIDGFPSADTLPLGNPGALGVTHLASSPGGLATGAESPGRRFGPWGYTIASHLTLRSILNRVLCHLYVPNKAYAQPHELADVVFSLAADLRQWYQAQPLDQQFVRDATVFSMNVPSVDLRMREIVLRYFSCVFLLHRPVLYFFLHKEMEYTVRPPDGRTLRSDGEPWILESCRDCIESAALIIYFSYISAEPVHVIRGSWRSWFHSQLLFAVYLILLQARVVPSLGPVLRNIGDVDGLLDRVEALLELSPIRSLKEGKSLEILRNERDNFGVSSPELAMSAST
ncbi:hypothetical protein VTK73DRAFT_6002 [Phialemonium thermophilum]|uniref:Zn(2)-C6 fungal-type domain-containing protein n=1 Tax=Phialemonium thermophilum TaxID=223376 RepID=A0ABR3WKW3_9PEZI